MTIIYVVPCWVFEHVLTLERHLRRYVIGSKSAQYQKAPRIVGGFYFTWGGKVKVPSVYDWCELLGPFRLKNEATLLRVPGRAFSETKGRVVLLELYTCAEDVAKPLAGSTRVEAVGGSILGGTEDSPDISGTVQDTIQARL
ncbi:hypothetical protein AAG570_004372 [Ranatra chinensis]|uniref:Uncharacterized protein n=1 Tax=Ranatra chinensis TaxID=642074 RepID=A0ABD0YMF3_9HEMI